MEQPDTRKQNWFGELRRRNVLRMAVLYGVTAWLIMQIAEVIVGLAALPEWIGQAVLGVLAIGFPIALIFAWVYEITPQGVKLEKDIDRSDSITHVTGRRMDFIVIAMLTAAVILFSYDKWWLGKVPDIILPPANSIAVLAFANMSPDPEQEYFSDGISEELLNLLAQVPGLKVIARTSSFSFKGEKADIATVAEQLNVRHVVEGSVRRSGDQVRITAQLIDTTDSTHIWSQNYDRDLTNIFTVQDEIARSIVESLKLRLAIGSAIESLPVSKARNTEVYETYLLGRHQLNERGIDNLDAAILNFQKAIELDPGFAAAYADQAIATLLLASPTDEHPPPSEGSIARARLLVDHAMALASDDWEVLAAAGKVEEVSENFELAMEYYDRSLATNPSNGEVHLWRMGLLRSLGRAAMRYDPHNFVVLHWYIRAMKWHGKIDDTLPVIRRMQVVKPALGELHLAEYYAFKGALAKAVRQYLKVEEMTPGVVTSLADDDVNSLFRVLARLGLRAEALKVAPDEDSVDIYFPGDPDLELARAREEYSKNPESREAVTNLLWALVDMDRAAEGADLAVTLWRLSGEDEMEFYPEGLIFMAMAARAADMDKWAERWGEAAHRRQDASLRDGVQHPWIHLKAAIIATYDGRRADAVEALSEAIAGGFRTRFWLEIRPLRDLADYAAFDAQRRRLNDILTAQRAEVVEMLIGLGACAGDMRTSARRLESIVYPLWNR
jgi:TolB-like protein